MHYLVALLLLMASYIYATPLHSSKDLVQMPSKGAIIAFQKNKVVIANLDTALTLKFLNTEGTEPKKSDATVHYKGLWKGIDLVYDNSKGLLTSYYTIYPNSDPSKIRVR